MERAAGWTLAALATYLGMFVLPYRFPLREPVMSDTWTAGANNQVAAIALALISVAVTLLCWYRNAAHSAAGDDEELDRRYLIGGIAAAVAWTLGLGWAVARAHMYWGDEGYFLNQLTTGLVFHQAIYRQFEFAYGPALYLWPALFIRALAPLGVSMTAAYLLSLAAMQSAGLGLLFYTVQALPMRRGLKTAAFVLITFGTLTSLLGINYSIFRFILPFATIVLLSRQKTMSRAIAVAGLGEMLQLAVSPELGIAFGGAVIAYAANRARPGNRGWMLVGDAAVAGAAAFAPIAGRDYFFTLGNMAKGGFNMLLTPAPHIVVFLVAAVALGPITVARLLRQAEAGGSFGGMILAIYVAALGVLPAALGRCDPIHVFFDGIGFYLLSFIALDAVAERWRTAAVAVIAGIFLLTQVQNMKLYRYRLAFVLRTHVVSDDWNFDEAALRRTIGKATISAPILAPQRVIEDLAPTGQYIPSYFCGWVGVWDRESEQRKIADMRRAEFALVAFPDPVSPDPAGERRIDRWMHFGLANHPRREPYRRGALLDAEIQQHWVGLGFYGDYVLLRQRHE